VASDPIKIDGLNAFVRNLKKLDSDLPKGVRVAFNSAADIVVQAARPDIPKRTGAAAGSVRARSTQTAARVVGGGAKASYYPWLDFGGKVGRGKSVARPFYTEGRYIYAAYFRKRDSGEFENVMTSALLDVVRSAGFEVD
jgi:hypothetical protein